MYTGIAWLLPDICYNMMRGVLGSRGIHMSILRIQQYISDVITTNTAMRPGALQLSSDVPYTNYIDENKNLVR